jgi:hypothetical protein
VRAVIRAWTVCLGIWFPGFPGFPGFPAHPTDPGIAFAAPGVDTRESYAAAVRLEDDGEYEKALIRVDDGLAIAPRDLRLLELKGRVLLQLRDYVGALAAYRAYLAAGATGRHRRLVEKIVDNLRAAESTFLDITLANGPAAIYLDAKSSGVFCTAAPSCNKAMLPGAYKVIAERDGFERWTQELSVEAGKTAALAIRLVEKPSPLVVRVVPPGARVLVDGQDHDAATPVAAGTHLVVVSLAGHIEERREVAAREGKPVELDVTLAPLIAKAAPAPAPAPVAPGSRSRTRTLGGMAIAAGGGLAITAGLVFGARARSTRAEVEALCGADRICDSDADYEAGHRLFGEARSDASTATLLIASGSAVLAAGLLVWLTAPSERPRPVARVVPTSHGGHDVGLTIVGSF